MSGTLAVARLTLQGIMRRGLVWVVAVLAAVVLFAALLLPVIAEEHHAARLRVVLLSGLECALLLATFVAAFGAGACIPEDIESRRLHLVLTRPCSRAGYLMGRFLGYVAALGALHAVWWVVILLGVQIGVWKGEIQPWQLDVQDGVPATAMRVGGASIALADAEGTSPTYFLSEAGDHADFDFVGLRAGAAELVLDLGAQYKTGYGPLRSSEVTVSILQGESWIEVQTLRMRFRKPLNVALSADAIVDGKLSVRLMRNDGRFDVYVRVDRATVRQPITGVAMNLARALFGLWVRSAVLVALALLAASLFSAPVAVLFALFLMLLGQISGFLDRYADTVIEAAAVAKQLGLEDKEDDHDHAESDTHTHAHAPKAPSAAAVELAIVGKRVLWILPDLEALDGKRELLSGLLIASAGLGMATLVAVAHMAGALGLALVAFWHRGVA